MECHSYIFLFIFLFAHYKINISSTLGQDTSDGTQQTALVNASVTNISKKEIKNTNLFNNNEPLNDWNLFNSWSCNTPQVVAFGSAVFYIQSSITSKEYLFRILLFGGYRKVGINLDSKIQDTTTTWIYYEETNSWKTVENVTNGPPAMSYPNLVTLCSSHVILLHADAINNTWIFILKQLEWKRVNIEGNGPHIGLASFVAVAVRSTTSACACSEDVLLIFDSSSPRRISFYRLSCVRVHATYRWREEGYHEFRHDAPHLDFVTTFKLPPETTVFVMIGNCLWTYSVEKSIWNKTENCILQKFLSFEPHNLHLGAALVSDTREILLFSLVHRQIARLSISNTSVYYEDILGFGPDIGTVYSKRALNSSKIMVYLSEKSEFCGSSTWVLQRDDVRRVWVWNKLNETGLVPPRYGVQSLWKDRYYRIVAPLYDHRNKAVQPVLWSLNIRTKQWQILGFLNFTEIDIEALYVSKSTHMEGNVWLIVSERFTTLITFKNSIQQFSHPIPAIRRFTLVTINSSSALLFGGLKRGGSACNDLWEFSLAHRNWKKLQPKEHELSVPLPRYDHSAAVLGFDMFIFGGTNGSSFCYEELWRYNLINGSWNILISTNNGPRLNLFNYCYTQATAQAGIIWITAIESCYFPCLQTEGAEQLQIWMFIVHLHTWDVVYVRRTRWRGEIPTFSLDFWQGYLLSPVWPDLFYMKTGCPRGTASRNISQIPCDVCKVGFYATNIGSSECRKCSSGTTTKAEGSSAAIECDVCITNYCDHGSCLVVNNNLTQVPVCTCDIGFSGSRCQYATYYYIGVAVFVIVGVLILLAYVLWRMRKKRKEKEMALRRHIQLLNDAWQIRWQEIRLRNEIGGGASGRVWKAQYRDIDVAVKLLIGDDDPQSSLEFAREIKFMQTMRHPNIVLFIGAGRTTERDQPFLVVEFAHRGSVRHVLDDVSIEMTFQRKLKFALDASKGMEFLHTLHPPRIHRDMKSENLLVSQSWLVKVADFGLGRPLHYKQESRQSTRKRSLIGNHSLTDPLLEMREGLSEDGIGTVRWRSPELSRGQSYDGSIDVYSFGIVLWEIWSRGFPFEQYRFGHAVEAAVERGERPVVPGDCPDEYANIMQACWSENPRQRPSFSEVVNCLQNVHVDNECMVE